MDFATVGIAAFRIVAGTFSPGVVTLFGESVHYLETDERAVSQCWIRIFPVNYRSADLAIVAIDIFRVLQPDDFPADLLSTPENFHLRLTHLGFPDPQNVTRPSAEGGCRRQQY